MSAYTTQAAILSQIQYSDLIRLTDDNGTGDVDSTVLNSIIEAASGYIDRKVGNIYQTPLAITPAVASFGLTIACYMLLRRRLIPDEKNNFTEDYNDVNTFLNDVNEGKMRLDLQIERSFSQVAYNARPTIFGSGNVLPNSM
jgi:phage gp36-like protein